MSLHQAGLPVHLLDALVDAGQLEWKQQGDDQLHPVVAADARAFVWIRTRGFHHLEDLIALLSYDQQALLTFLEVIHMLRAPLALVHPLLVMKVLAHRWRT